MSTIETLTKSITSGLGLDSIYTDMNERAIVYQLLYIGLEDQYGSHNYYPSDYSINPYLSANGLYTVQINVLGNEMYFVYYNGQIQGLTADGNLVFYILHENNNYKLYDGNTFGFEYEYIIDNFDTNKADHYFYSEKNGNKSLADGFFTTLPNGVRTNLYKLSIYEPGTKQIVKDDSFITHLIKGVKKELSINDPLAINGNDPCNQSLNIYSIFDVLKTRLRNYYREYDQSIKIRKHKK